LGGVVALGSAVGFLSEEPQQGIDQPSDDGYGAHEEYAHAAEADELTDHLRSAPCVTGAALSFVGCIRLFGGASHSIQGAVFEPEGRPAEMGGRNFESVLWSIAFVPLPTVEELYVPFADYLLLKKSPEFLDRATTKLLLRGHDGLEILVVRKPARTPGMRTEMPNFRFREVLLHDRLPRALEFTHEEHGVGLEPLADG
jgi:hypothetical protein